MNYSLRKWDLKDAPDLAKALNNKNIHDNLRDGLPYPYTTTDAECYINSVLEAEKDSQYMWAIDVDGKAKGSMGIFRKDNVHRRTAEVGYYLAEDLWGKGIVAQALKDACQFIFEHTDILRIFGEPYAYNTASCHVLEKADFTFEGTLRQNAVKNGKILDMKLYSLLREEAVGAKLF
ncbi:GNAT family N-acetyltransferase [Lachnospiraceae bacterium ZAX-1]